MDPVELTELMQRTENIEMILQEISAVRPFTVAVVLLVLQVIGTVAIALVGWFGRGFLGAFQAHQAKQDEINQQLLLIPGEVKKSYETTVAEIKARSESLDDILKEVRATQAAVSAVELLYDADRLMNERRYEFAVTTLTQLIEALYISLHNHKLLLKSEYNELSNLINRGVTEFPVLSDEEFKSLDAICEAQQPIITSMMARAPIIFGSNILEIVDRYQDDIGRNRSKDKGALGDRLNVYKEIVSIEEEAYTLLVREGRTVLFRLPDNNPPSA